MSKIVSSAAEAIVGVESGMTIMSGGFGPCGIPEKLIEAVRDTGVKDLLTISNDIGTDTYGLAILLPNKQIRKSILSGIWFSKEVSSQYMAGDVGIELIPQGSLAERIRAGGAGIPAFYTPTAVGTVIEKGGFPIRYDAEGNVIEESKPREVREFKGRKYLMEEALTGDVALLKAWKADSEGNLVFRYTARNFNPAMATACKLVVAEVEEIVPAGEISPDEVHVPGIYVDRIYQAPKYEKLVLNKCTRKETVEGEKKEVVTKELKELSNRELIARRCALEFQDGMYVNLGIGMPTMSANFIPDGINIKLQSENGILGLGPYPTESEVDPDLVNAGCETTTPAAGAASFDSPSSFGMIRGQHVAMSVLGGMQVAENGDLANWMIPRVMVKGMGGAMDLVSSGSRVVITMDHCDKKGRSKILKACTLPLTGANVVSRVITDLCVFDVDRENGGLTLVEKRDDISMEDLKARTEADFKVSDNLISYRCAGINA